MRCRIANLIGVVAFSVSCSQSSAPGGSPVQPTNPNFSVSVSSVHNTVLFGQTETVTATASDGRSMTGVWSSDNPLVATVSNTPGTSATVTPVGAGNVSLTFTASTGQAASKSLRMIPDLSGYSGGCARFTVHRCVDGSGRSVGVGGLVGELYRYDFTFEQSASLLNGKAYFNLESHAVDANIEADGSISIVGGYSQNGSTVTVKWTLSADRPGVLRGTIDQHNVLLGANPNTPASQQRDCVFTATVESWGRSRAQCNASGF